MTTLTPLVSKLREWAKVYGGMDCSVLLRDAANEIEMQQAAIAKLLESHDRLENHARAHISMGDVSVIAKNLACGYVGAERSDSRMQLGAKEI